MTRMISGQSAIALVAALLFAAACGVEGPPRAPEAVSEPGMRVSGEARIGVSGSF